jgi:hypothetical protein
MRDGDPGGYVRVIASLLPKEFKIETTSDLTDEQLDARIRALASLIEVGVAELLEEAKRRKDRRRLTEYRPYAKQREFHAAGLCPPRTPADGGQPARQDLLRRR